MSETTKGFNTNAIHAGAKPDPTTGARATPIYQTASYVFEDTDHAANLFAGKAFGNSYTRIMNPTQAVLEERVAALEGGTAALAVASGHAAQLIALHPLLSAGNEFIASDKLYGGSINQFTHSFKKFDWNVKWASGNNIDSYKSLINEKTRAIFVESIANPGGIITDIEPIARIAEDAGIPLIVDNTAAPIICKPIEHGTTELLLYIILGNSVGGIIFGWIYWKKGLESAMIAHIFAHILMILGESIFCEKFIYLQEIRDQQCLLLMHGYCLKV